MSTLPPGPWNTGAEREGDPVAVVGPGDAEEARDAALVERLAAGAVDVHHVEPGEAAPGQGERAGRRARRPGSAPARRSIRRSVPGGAPQASTFGESRLRRASCGKRLIARRARSPGSSGRPARRSGRSAPGRRGRSARSAGARPAITPRPAACRRPRPIGVNASTSGGVIRSSPEPSSPTRQMPHLPLALAVEEERPAVGREGRPAAVGDHLADGRCRRAP